MPIRHDDIRKEALKDSILSKVNSFISNGWPNHVSDQNLMPYFKRRNKLSIERGIILWGIRVVIPPKFRKVLVDELHSEHHGIVRMKMLARGYFWYPGLDSDIDDAVLQ